MRYAITTIACLVVLLGAARPAGSATPAGCEASPTRVTRSPVGIHAGPVTITCQGSWQAHESVIYSPTQGTWAAGKWTYGGDRTVNGAGSRTLAGFNRAYHHCAHWRLRVTLRDRVYDGPITRFCSG